VPLENGLMGTEVRAGRALIVEGLYDRGALAACRALHAAGWTVGVASSPGEGLAASSRWTSGRFPVPPPQKDLPGFVAAVDAAVQQGGYEVVFSGGGDAEALALSLRRQQIGAIVPYPPHENVLRMLDKLELNRAAERVGLEVPFTVEASEAELERHAPPYVLKARVHAPFVEAEGPSRIATRFVPDRDIAQAVAAEMRAGGGVPLVQELVQGRLIAFVVVADRESRVVARAQQLADRIWPPLCGVSSRAHTVAIDEPMAARVQALLEELEWTGIAELQFMQPVGSAPKLIDINGRCYGSLALAVEAGVNLPAIWAALATGRPTPPGGDARPGVRYQWLEADLRRALVERRRGLVRDLADCIRSAGGGTVHSIWDPEDRRPLLRAIRSLAARGLRRLRRT
jgi:predicted ATP-grasp superfamily ATP-dependent carboligase